MKVLLILLVMLLTVVWLSAQPQEPISIKASNDVSTDTIEVRVFYEALCIDSINFFTRKLRLSMVDKKRLPNTDLKLIPYGKVLKSENPETHETELYCQHGERECKLNALHACIIENNKIGDAFNVIACLMTGFRTDFDECAKDTNVNVQVVRDCTKGRTIAQILEKYGKETDAINIQFVPTIGIDQKIDEDEQSDLRNNFDKVFCEKFKNKYKYTLPDC